MYKRGVPMPKPLTVSQPAALLAYLFASWPDVKKTQVRTWLKVGAVTVNGRSVTHFDHALRRGDVIEIRSERGVTRTLATGFDLEIRFEDEDLLVVEKPAGLLSIATETGRENTAYRQLTEYVKTRDRRASDRIWVVHRLDRETSGLMVFAKTQASKRSLQETWDSAVKHYLAVVEGKMTPAHGKLSSHLDESQPHKVFSTRPSASTRLAVTRFEVIAETDERSLVELTLETGRRHQIRVHLADEGHPVVGDAKYGAATDPAKRLALHSSGLAFAHPRSRESMSFESPLPAELARLVGRRGGLASSRPRR